MIAYLSTCFPDMFEPKPGVSHSDNLKSVFKFTELKGDFTQLPMAGVSMNRMINWTILVNGLFFLARYFFKTSF